MRRPVEQASLPSLTRASCTCTSTLAPTCQLSLVGHLSWYYGGSMLYFNFPQAALNMQIVSNIICKSVGILVHKAWWTSGSNAGGERIEIVVVTSAVLYHGVPFLRLNTHLLASWNIRCCMLLTRKCPCHRKLAELKFCLLHRGSPWPMISWLETQNCGPLPHVEQPLRFHNSS